MYLLTFTDTAAGSCHQDLLMHNNTIRVAAGLLTSCAILTATITAAQAAPLTTTPGTDDGFLRTTPTVPVHHGQYGPDTTLTQARKAAGVTMMGLSTFPVWDNPTLATSLSAVLSSAALQQLVGSPMVRYINSLPDTMPGVRYTALATKHDTTSTPYDATFLKPVRGATVTNVTVENVCKPGEMLDHNKLTTNQAVQVLVLRALQNKQVTCSDTQWAL